MADKFQIVISSSDNVITINPSSKAFDIEWLIVIHPCVLNGLVECQKNISQKYKSLVEMFVMQ